MKPLPEPPRQDFAMYVARPETLWIERGPEDSLETLYARGYLPYSGAIGLKNIFYSARSARIVLPAFQPSSENRRIAKKFDGRFETRRMPALAFGADEIFWSLCLNYFKEKHGATAMPRERLETILESGLVSHITTYQDKERPVAYVLEVEEGSMGHYWFSFYDLSLVRQSLGLWLMGECIRAAKERGLTHYYLGTVYGEKALYKSNFEPLEWWDGTGWNTDVALLREQGRADVV